MGRRQAREAVYKLVFEYVFNQEVNERTFAILVSDATLTAADKEYIESTYKGIIEHYDILCGKIARYTDKYSSLARLVKSDLAAMIVAVYELIYSADVPHSVAINEAVDMVKQYGTEKSSGFVNGVLASINKELENN
jgi:N utilization substance protein B